MHPWIDPGWQAGTERMEHVDMAGTLPRTQSRILTSQEVQGVLIDILRRVISVCESHRIGYFMIGGCCLGIVRHDGGFVPWDDDLDLAVRADDLPRLFQALTVLPPPFKACLAHDMYCPIIKVFDQRTRIHSTNKDDGTSIFIDIIPFMHWKSHGWKRLDNKISLLRHKFSRDGQSRIRKLARITGFNGAAVKVIDLLTRVYEIHGKSYYYSATNEPSGIVSGAFGRRWKGLYEYDVIFPTHHASFCDMDVRVPCDLERFLTLRYGSNYMDIPDASQRWEHFDKAEWIGNAP